MKTKPTKSIGLLILACFLVTDLAIAVVAFMPVEHRRDNSPDGRYTAITTQRFYRTLLASAPGDSGSGGGFITIRNDQNDSMGKIPVPNVDLANELEWREDGASIKLVGSWDFTKQEIRYWSSQSEQEVVKRAQ